MLAAMTGSCLSACCRERSTMRYKASEPIRWAAALSYFCRVVVHAWLALFARQVVLPCSSCKPARHVHLASCTSKRLFKAIFARLLSCVAEMLSIACFKLKEAMHVSNQLSCPASAMASCVDSLHQWHSVPSSGLFWKHGLLNKPAQGEACSAALDLRDVTVTGIFSRLVG